MKWSQTSTAASSPLFKNLKVIILKVTNNLVRVAKIICKLVPRANEIEAKINQSLQVIMITNISISGTKKRRRATQIHQL